MRFHLLIISCILLVLPTRGGNWFVNPTDTLKTFTEKLIDKAKETADNPQKKYDLAQESVKYAYQLGDSLLIGKALLSLGQAHLLVNNYTEAIENGKKASELFTQYNDSLNIARCFNLQGTCYMRRAQYGNAIDCFEKTLQISIKINDSLSIASGYNNLGIVYYNSKRLDNAKKYFIKSLKIYQALNQTRNEAKIEGNIGLIALDEGKYEEANQHFNLSLKLREELKDTLMLANIYNNIGNAQEKLNNYAQSLDYYKLSFQYFEKTNSRHGIALSAIAMARVQIKLGDYANAYKNLKEGQGIATKDQEKSFVMESYKLLSEYYSKTGDYKQSREMLLKYVDIFEKSYNDEVTEKIAELQVQLDTIQKEHDIKLLSTKLEVQQLKAKQSNRLKTFYSIVAILLLVLLGITLLFIVQQRNKNRAIKKFNLQLSQFNDELEKMVKNRTRDLSEALEKVKELEKIKSAFLNNISHEIRTPLNGILGFTQYLVSPEVSPEDKQQCNKIVHKLGNKLLRIVDDILELSKIETNQLDLRFSDTNINELLGELYQTFSNSDEFAIKDLHFRLIKSLPDSQAIFSIDAFRVKKIMSHLIENAFKFTSVGSIEFGYYADSPTTIKFFVKDTGIGIPKKIQKRVFERFFKHIAEDHVAKYDGTGIGLTIAKGYAFSMGGRLEMESSPDNGSTFYFFLPKNTSSSHKTDSNENISLSWKDKTILIVEDDLISYQYIDALLKNSDARLIHVKNAEDAIEVCSINKNINLIIMDIQLPFMDGVEATKIIRKVNETVPIIAQSANSLNEENQTYIDAGCNAFITKPIDPDELFNYINRYIQ
ncbi:histidine kinase [Tenuifilaceae bacterium CYCD]|nr:histidine kinase [Tenuifilaceae bacterium CYCD]